MATPLAFSPLESSARTSAYHVNTPLRPQTLSFIDDWAGKFVSGGVPSGADRELYEFFGFEPFGEVRDEAGSAEQLLARNPNLSPLTTPDLPIFL